MPNRIIIAIDGHSACGKSTLAKDLAQALNYLYVDSGAMYRATTYYFIENNVQLQDPLSVEQALTRMPLLLAINPDGASGLYLGQEYLTNQIRSLEVNARVSQVSAIGMVRKAMVKIQQEVGKNRGIVMDGRDIGSVVFPNAELKIFLTASLAVRADRRLKEVQEKALQMTHQDIEKNLRQRDYIDSTRTESPLIQTDDAVVIDNTNLTREEQLAMVLALARLRMQ
jgi:CMP/dCMP kinase